jgi:hypothetical protein
MLALRTTQGQTLYILEPSNLDKLKNGEPIQLSNGDLIAYSPDPEWVMDRVIAEFGKMNPAKLDNVLKESLKRPEVRDRPHHSPIYLNQNETKSD